MGIDSILFAHAERSLLTQVLQSPNVSLEPATVVKQCLLAAAAALEEGTGDTPLQEKIYNMFPGVEAVAEHVIIGGGSSSVGTTTKRGNKAEEQTKKDRKTKLANF
uniref:Uncharacterized protein n=1 Tax=Heterosigma akashiwo TaxID=2829 RepID=A0A7S3YMS1_HETAK